MSEKLQSIIIIVAVIGDYFRVTDIKLLEEREGIGNEGYVSMV